MIMKPGSYKISADIYHQDGICPEPSLSRSTIKDLIQRTPRHAWENHPRLNPDYQSEEKAIFDLGSAAHSIFLEGIDKAFVVEADDWRKKENQQARDDARSMGLHPLLRHQYDEVLEMVQVATTFIADAPELQIKSLALEGESELTFIWQEKDVWCRCRPDWISNNKCLILDYKTSSGLVEPESYVKILINNGLDIQHAFYTRGVEVVDRTFPKFVFLLQETSRPYLCSLMELDPAFVEIGMAKVKRGIDLWRKCLTHNEWPGYPNDIYSLTPPSWAIAQWEGRNATL